MARSAEAPGDTGSRPGRVPDFFIVGHPKSGTTALYEMLREHPQIYMPDLKETRFFDRETHRDLELSPLHPATLEEYLALFAEAKLGQRAGEASPSYLRTPMTPGRIAQVQPEARVIAILREPASFVRSMHMELLKDHVESEPDLRKAIASEELSLRAREPEDSPARRGKYLTERVRYVEQLRRYHTAFTREQVLVLIYDDFRRDNEAIVRAVLRFLGVDDKVDIALSEANTTVRVRSARGYDLVRSLYMGRGPIGRTVNTGIKALTPRRVRHAGLRAMRRHVLYGSPGAPDGELMLELRRRFAGEVVALSEYLDRDLVSLWGYEDLV